MFKKRDRRATMRKRHPVTPQPLPTTNPSPTPALRTTPEAAADLSIEPGTLEQWRWNGRGPRFVKIGRSVRYRPADLELFLAERIFSSTTEAASDRVTKNPAIMTKEVKS
jgi:hypothetical protein